jgi:response regulator RpfG family c-di-GMP phosphodiesterase
MPKILLVGEDEGLLETRSEVLKRTGAIVTSHIGDDALKVVQSKVPDLVVVCHSLPTSDAESMADEVRRCCPKTRILLVLSELGVDRPYKDTKFDATSPAEPSKLIERATELLGILPHHTVEAIAGDTQGTLALL